MQRKSMIPFFTQDEHVWRPLQNECTNKRATGSYPQEVNIFEKYIRDIFVGRNKLILTSCELKAKKEKYELKQKPDWCLGQPRSKQAKNTSLNIHIS